WSAGVGRADTSDTGTKLCTGSPGSRSAPSRSASNVFARFTDPPRSREGPRTTSDAPGNLQRQKVYGTLDQGPGQVAAEQVAGRRRRQVDAGRIDKDVTIGGFEREPRIEAPFKPDGRPVAVRIGDQRRARSGRAWRLVPGPAHAQAQLLVDPIAQPG